MTVPVSVFLVTHDCERHLAEVLTPVRDFAQIVVVDSGSTDNTRAIARSFGATVIERDWAGFAKQKQFALEQCHCDWVLNLDGDEVMNAELRNSIIELVQTNDPAIDGAVVKIRDWFMGRPPPAGTRPIRRVRLFRRSQAHYQTDVRVHESITLPPSSKTVVLAGYLEHFGVESITLRVDKINRYSALRAEDDWHKGRRGSLPRLLLIFPLTFFKAYILRRAFLQGVPGLIQATHSAFYAFLKEARLHEREQLAASADPSVVPVGPKRRQDD